MLSTPDSHTTPVYIIIVSQNYHKKALKSVSFHFLQFSPSAHSNHVQPIISLHPASVSLPVRGGSWLNPGGHCQVFFSQHAAVSLTKIVPRHLTA